MFHTIDNIKPNSFNGVAIDEGIESEVTKGKFKIEVEENYWLIYCQFLVLLFWSR